MSDRFPALAFGFRCRRGRAKVIAMVTVLTFGSSLVVAPTALAASTPHSGATPAGHGVADRTGTLNFAAVARQAQSAPEASPRAAPAPGRLGRSGRLGRGAPAAGEAPAIQAPAAGALAPQPLSASFAALGDNGTSTPPDTDGAAGPNHLMVALNSGVRVEARSGGVVSTVTLESFFATVLPSGSTGLSDPHARYDPYAGRWMLTAAGDFTTVKSAIYLAVSRTSDPTGTWNLFSVVTDPSGVLYADFPLIGFNKDWITVTLNLFTDSGDVSKGSRIVVFDKAKLYGNIGNGAHTTFNDINGFAQAPAVTYSTTLATVYLIEDWDGTAAQVRVSTVTGPVGSEVYTTNILVALPTGTWADFTPATGVGFAPQQGSTAKIDTGDSRIPAVEYRNGALWFAHTIFLPTNTPTRAAVQWAQLTTSPSLGVSQAGRIDDSTGAHFYAYPSIAANAYDDALMGYSSFGTGQFASADYTFRARGDALNTMRTDTVLKAGQAPYLKTFGGTSNRWGDFSTTVVDPLNDTSMWTIQEYAAAPSGGTDRWGTWWGSVTGSRRSPGDFDGDGTTDVAVFRPSTGTWYITNSGGGVTVASWGASGDIAVPGDFNGDGNADVAVFRPSTGTWYISNSGAGGVTATSWGASGDIAVPGDFNGDGKADVAVFRPSTGTWYISNSGAGGVTVSSWGASGDVPVPGDFNGDGKADVAVFRPSTGTWYISNSGGGVTVTSWGAAGDVPVAGDFNGDGKADVAVFRPSTGTWYINNSGGGVTVTSWGVSGDIPVVGDFNGDGKADVAVFRPSTGAWYINLSGGGVAVTSWGATGDMPVGQPPGP